MTDQPKLKPCPHCGENSIQRPKTGDYTFWDHPKNDCWLSGETFLHNGTDNSHFYNSWNTRTPPKLKDFVWSDLPEKEVSGIRPSCSTNEHLFGQYHITFDDGNSKYYPKRGYELSNDECDISRFETLDQAKKYAQDNYNNLILSALDI